MTLVVFIASSYGVYLELPYVLWGATTQALVGKTEEGRRGTRGGSYAVVEISYTLIDEDGRARLESDEVPGSWLDNHLGVLSESGRKVSVEYVPRQPGWSRIAGQERLWVFIPFVLSVGAMVYLGARWVWGRST